ncbi:hypothetical protein QFZ42_004276 [Variovorax paradoxus]|uniref:hypothetical protein n=1 Tax=Variovorax paradoxus TaxID=34073 RepID=UPI00278E288D|nr:hypothetical protein [Variovorax paradoxus]MDQ0572442.1 hypothetical protein [Variovorax paradoxus]
MSRQKKITLCVIGFACLFHVLAVMGYLQRSGRLAIVPIYDDVVYLIDGLKRLEVLERSGLIGFAASFFSLPAHSPFNTLSATFGLMMSGGAVWGAYLLNASWVFVIVGLALLVLRKSGNYGQIGIVLALLATPILGSLVAEFRPDPAWGLLVGFSLALTASVDVTLLRTSRLLGLGLLFGAAVLAKPTAAPATIVVLGVGLVTQTALTLILQRRWSTRLFVRALVLVAIGAVLFITPYAVTNGLEILAYIRTVMGSDIGVWGVQASLLEHLTFYLNRGAGTSMLGWVWYWMVPIFAICVCVLIRVRDKRSLCGLAGMAVAALAAYAIVTASQMKTMMIGSILYGTIVAITVWCLGQIVIHIRVRRKLLPVLGALVFATQWVPRAGMIQQADPAMATTDKASRAVFPEVLRAFASGNAKTALVTVPGPVYAGTLDFLARQQGVARNFIWADTWNSWDLFLKGVAVSDVIILSEPGMKGQALGFNFPGVKFQAPLLKLLQGDQAFSGRPVYTDEQGRSVWVFVRK